MSRASSRLLALTASLALIGVAACEDDRATITEPAGRVYNTRFAGVGSNLPRGVVNQEAGGTATQNSIYVEIQGLEALDAGEYKVWLGIQPSTNEAPTVVVPATGSLDVMTVDTSFTPEGDPIPDTSFVNRVDVASFTEGGPRVTIQLTVDSGSLARAGAANTDPGAYTLVFVTIEPTAGATAPTAAAPHPLWARLFDMADEDSRVADFRFGNFDPDVNEEYVFQPSGRGLAGIWENILVVDDSALSLPPEGYYYATVLTRLVPRPGVADSFDLMSIQLGPQKAPYPRRDVSLEDADINPDIDPVVTLFPPSILAASDRVRIDTVPNAVLAGAEDQPFRRYQAVLVTLETKQGVDTPSATVILAAGFPAPASIPPED